MFLACYSAASLRRKESWQNEELNLAVEQMRLLPVGEPWLIPVRLSDCELPDIDIGGGRSLGSIQRCDLFGKDAEANAGRLVTAIRRILGNAGAEPPDVRGHVRSVPRWRRYAMVACGVLFIVASGVLVAWVVGNGSKQHQHAFPSILHDPGSTGVYAVAFSSNGSTLAAGDLNGGAYLWNVVTGRLTVDLRNPRCQGVYGVAISRRGSNLAAATVNRTFTSGGTCLWDVPARKLIAVLRDPNGAGATSAAFSPDGKTLATDGNSGAYLWDVATHKLTATLNDPDSQKGYAVAFSPAGGKLAVADGNGDVYLWDVATGKLSGTLSGPAGQAATSVAFSPDGTAVIAGDANGTLYLWNIATGKLARTFRSPGSQRVNGVAFSRDGTTIAATISGPRDMFSICLWEVASRSLILTLHDPDSTGAFPIAISPENNVVAVGDANANTYLWKLSRLHFTG